MNDYVPADYWTERGRGYEQEMRQKGWWDVENEPLFDLLDTLEFDSVLDVGCGFGRVGAALRRHYPNVAYTGVDVSPDMIESARKRVPDGELFCADLATWEPQRSWDLVVSVSVLGHLLPADIGFVVAKLRGWAVRDVVAIDWDDVGASTEFQFGHPYRELYGEALVSVTPYGRQSIFHVRPAMSWQDAFG